MSGRAPRLVELPKHVANKLTLYRLLKPVHCRAEGLLRLDTLAPSGADRRWPEMLMPGRFSTTSNFDLDLNLLRRSNASARCRAKLCRAARSRPRNAAKSISDTMDNRLPGVVGSPHQVP
jgi:hypothetical protein